MDGVQLPGPHLTQQHCHDEVEKVQVYEAVLTQLVPARASARVRVRVRVRVLAQLVPAEDAAVVRMARLVDVVGLGLKGLLDGCTVPVQKVRFDAKGLVRGRERRAATIELLGLGLGLGLGMKLGLG